MFQFNPNDLHRLNRMMFVLRGQTDEAAGGHRTRKIGQGTDFLDFRPYVPGDDFRNVDWTLYGRLRQLFVRLHEAPQQLSVTLLIDTSRSMGFGGPSTKLLMAQQIACALGFIALRSGDRLFASTFSNGVGEFVGPLSSARGLPALVRMLSRCSAGGESDLPKAVQQIQARGRKRGLFIVLSDFLNIVNAEDALAAMVATGGRVLAVQVLDPIDRGAGLGGTVRLRDSESGRMVDVRVDSASLAKFQRRFDDRREQLEGFCRRRGQQYIQASTSDNYLDLVCQALRAKAVVK